MAGPSPAMPPAVESPCIRRCTLDPTGNLCTGCGRTRAEIGAWGGPSPAARRAIMETLPARRRATVPQTVAGKD